MAVASRAGVPELRCGDRDAFNRAIKAHKTVAFELDARELHVWRGQPNTGDRCQCGTRTWV